MNFHSRWQSASTPTIRPGLLAFHDALSVIEQHLFRMHLEHRMWAFQGAFHNNLDYALWYGWSEMVQELTGIRALARDLREACDVEWGPFAAAPIPRRT